jgi:hypothetical protein
MDGMPIADEARLAFRRTVASSALTMLCVLTSGQLVELVRHTELGCWLGQRLNFMVDPRYTVPDVAFRSVFMFPLYLLVFGAIWWWAPKSLVAITAQRIERSRRRGKKDGAISRRFVAFLCVVSLLVGSPIYWLAASYVKLSPSWKSCPSVNGVPGAPSPSGSSRGPPPCPANEEPAESSLPCT